MPADASSARKLGAASGDDTGSGPLELHCWLIYLSPFSPEEEDITNCKIPHFGSCSLIKLSGA